VVIDNFNIYRARRSGRPFKAYPPLVVDADTVLAFAVAPQRFEAVAGQRRKVLEARGRFQTVELQTGGPLYAGKGFDPFAGGEDRGPLVPDFGPQNEPAEGLAPFVLRGCKYNRTELTFSFSNSTSDLPGDRALEIVREAFRAWEKVSTLRLTEVALTNALQPGSEYFVPNWPNTPAGEHWSEVTQKEGGRDVKTGRHNREPIFAWEAKVYRLRAGDSF